MERPRVRPHRLALILAITAVLAGAGLLITPWDGPVIVLAWILIIAGVIGGALALFFVRTPRS